jgi:hypothetical protein
MGRVRAANPSFAKKEHFGGFRIEGEKQMQQRKRQLLSTTVARELPR